MKKRLLSALLALFMVMVLLPTATTTAHAAGTGVADKLNALKTKYPDGAYWNHYVSEVGQDCDSLSDWDETYADSVTSTACAHHGDGYSGNYVGLYDCNRFDGGSQCWGFARKIFFDVFGVKCSSLVPNGDSANVQVGDYVRFGPDDGGHSFIVIGRTDNIITVVECNFGDAASSHCQIKWGRSFDITDTVYGLRFNYSYHAPNYDEVNGSAIEPSQPDPSDPSQGTYGNLTYKIENGEITITGCTSSSPKNVAIPAEIDGIPVTSIGNQAFFMKSISSLTIPSSITSIGDSAFNMCFDLTSVTIPNSVTKIGDGAFANNHLTSVTIPSSVTSLGGSVFFGCKELTNVTIPNSVTSISRGMFAQCSSLTSVNVPNGVTNIGEEAFSDCHSLTSITIPTSVTSIGEYAFNGCTGLTSMTIPNSVTNIGPRAFSDCTGLTDVSISNNISSIAEGMFLNCTRLTSVTIPKGITNIGGAAFSDCTSLTSVIIPDSVTSIGDYAFNQCFALEDVYFAGNAEQWKEIDISVATMKSYDGDGNLIGVSSNDPIFTATIHCNDTDLSNIKQIIQQLVGDAKKVLGVASIRCPVDVEISVNGQSVGQIVDNVASGVDESKIYVHVENDEKYIYFLTSDKFTINLTATGTGTMEYSAQNLDVPSWTTLDEKYFRKVELTSGKKMVSDIDYLDTELVDTPNVQLYVLGGADNSTPVKKVLPDNKGTEVPLNTPVITFDTAVDSISILPMAVGNGGVLSEIPVPTRNGYTFNGWYKPDGTKVDTNTVFTADTTVKAQWTKNSTGGDSPSNPGGSTTTPTVPSGPSYNPGGTYTPSTHSITTPSVTGGKVSVSPSSASSGSIVTVTATPDTGYELASLTVSDSTGKALELTTRGNGQYSFKMPNGKVSLSVEFRLANTNTSWNNPFVDVSIGDWYYDAVRFVSENGLMNGVGNGYFSPNMNLSRAMFAQILYNKAGRPSAVGSSAFNDVPIGAWYTDAVTWAAANDIVGGYGNGAFGPDDPITREQLAVMLWRYAGKPVPPNLLLNFSDTDHISEYALDALFWATENGIINGKGGGILDPRGQATRAQVAQMLMNYLKK